MRYQTKNIIAILVITSCLYGLLFIDLKSEVLVALVTFVGSIIRGYIPQKNQENEQQR